VKYQGEVRVEPVGHGSLRFLLRTPNGCTLNIACEATPYGWWGFPDEGSAKAFAEGHGLTVVEAFTEPPYLIHACVLDPKYSAAIERARKCVDVDNEWRAADVINALVAAVACAGEKP
jgi:hypothetical protein